MLTLLIVATPGRVQADPQSFFRAVLKAVVLRDAYQSMHPGLYRYNTPA
jgi:hypothetical protein